MKREQKPSHISQAIKIVFGDIEQKRAGGTSKEDILSAWHKVAGSKAAKHSSPAALRGKTLLVNVDSTAWIYQLRLREPELTKKMGRLLKKHGIERIRFRAGEVDEKKES